MKRKVFLFITLVIIPFLIISCGKTSREDEKSGETSMQEESKKENIFWTSDRNYSFEEKDQFRHNVDEAISKLNAKIQTLQQEANGAAEETKQMYNERISELKEYKDNIKTKMTDFASVSEENWEDFKTEITSAWDDIENSYDQLTREIDQDRDKVY